MVGEFKVLQANFGAENAKGPTTINVVSKAGGRDFSGTGYPSRMPGKADRAAA